MEVETEANVYEPFEDYVKQVELNNTCNMKMTHSTLCNW